MQVSPKDGRATEMAKMNRSCLEQSVAGGAEVVEASHGVTVTGVGEEDSSRWGPNLSDRCREFAVVVVAADVGDVVCVSGEESPPRFAFEGGAALQAGFFRVREEKARARPCSEIPRGLFVRWPLGIVGGAGDIIGVACIELPSKPELTQV